MILRPGQAAVADRPADHEPARRVDEEVLQQLLLVEQVVRQDRQQHMLEQIGLDQRLRVDAVAVLGGDQHLLDLHRPAVEIAHRDLGLAVRTQIRDDLGLAHIGQPLGQLVRQRDRQRHQLVRLVARVTEHHPLIAGAGHVQRIVVGRIVTRLVSRIDALGNVRRLLVDRVDHRTRIGAEPEIRVGVTDPPDRLARDVLHIDIGRCRDLSRHHDQTRVHQRLARHTSVGIITQDRVEDAIGDLIGDLVGMALGHGLGREQVLGIRQLSHKALLSAPLRVTSRRYATNTSWSPIFRW